MYGGLKKSASRLALIAAAGVLSTNAFAADLGGDCCADLEERVAELEATTARKGTRKTSLEIYGQVNRAITYWNDGSRSNATLGYDNWSAATRFGFRGMAKVSPSITSGYSILLDIGDGARTGTFGQTQDVGSSKLANQQRGAEDPAVRMRDANFWIESNQIGRLTVGRFVMESDLGSPDLAGLSAGISDDVGCNGGGLGFRASDGTLKAMGTYLAGGGCAAPLANRTEGVKYTTPNLFGFTAVASISRNAALQAPNQDSTPANVAYAGRELSIVGRYAGEFSGVRIAGNIGYQKEERDRAAGFQGSYSNGDAFETLNSTGVGGNFSSGSLTAVDFGAAALHVPTGLFVQGHYTRSDYFNQDPLTAGSIGALDGARGANNWHITAGIARNFFGLGNTAFYGEYLKSNNMAYAEAGYGLKCAVGVTECSVTTVGTTSTLSPIVSGDSVRTWGLGINQAVDAAAMDLYVNYRNHQLSDPNLSVSTQSLSVVTTGARIKF